MNPSGFWTLPASIRASIPDFFKRHDAHRNPYQQLKNEGSSAPQTNGIGPTPTRDHRGTRLSRYLFTLCGRRYAIGALGLVALLLLVAQFSAMDPSDLVPSPEQADHRLYLLIPSSNEPDIGFCRTELTAGILGYPTPLILNTETAGRSDGEQERDRLRVIHDHLVGMGKDRNDDMVILLDDASAWFQLRPEVLMKRYYRIIERANKRLAKQAGQADAPTQRIVFAAQNHCSGHTLDEVACFAPPPSPLDDSSTLRYLSSGLIIGPVRDMRRMFNRVTGKAIARYGQQLSYQGLLAEAFGEQEFRREYVRQGAWSSSRRKLDGMLKALSKSNSVTAAIPGRRLLEDPESPGYELGIGLDYGNELGLSMSRLADRDRIDWISHEKDAARLPRDIKDSMPPYWTTTSSSSLPIEKTWTALPLLTSKRTGEIPAIVSISGDARSSSRGGLDWRTLWLHSHAKELWEAQQEVSRLPLTSVMDGGGTEHIFWNQELRMNLRDGANWLEGGWKPWTDHCGWSDAGDVLLVPSR